MNLALRWIISVGAMTAAADAYKIDDWVVRVLVLFVCGFIAAYMAIFKPE